MIQVFKQAQTSKQGAYMNFIKAFTLGAVLLAGSMQAESFGLNLGPFSMQINVDGSYYANDYKDILDNPICQAISNQKQLDMIVESKETINSKEVKFITKRLIVDPYAFAITSEGKPVLNGSIAHEKLIKEVTIKYGEEKFGNSGTWTDKKEEGFFSGWFKSDKGQNIDIQKINNLYVLSASHFEAPKNYKGLKDDNIRVICQLPISAK